MDLPDIRFHRQNAQAQDLYERSCNVQTPVKTRMKQLMQALTLSQETKNQFLEAKILHCLGYTTSSRVERVQYYAQSVKLSRKIHNVHLQATFLFNIGNDPAIPLEYRLLSYERASSLAEHLKDVDFQAQIYYYRGHIETTIAKRLHCYNKAIGFVRISKNKELETRILLAYGEIDKHHQLHWCQQALNAARESGNNTLVISVNRILLESATKLLGFTQRTS